MIITMSHNDSKGHLSWWKLVLNGVLAIAFGIAAVALPANIISGRIMELVLGVAKPFSAGMTAVAALLALVALVATDGLLNLLGKGVTGRSASKIRGITGIVIAGVAIFWPDQTVFVAVELIGIWAILVGVVELTVARYSHKDAKDRTLLIIAALASIAIGICIMTKVVLGAVVVGALVGLAAAARGISLVLLGLSYRPRGDARSARHATGRHDAA
jgi:uncharacterized membrane protein HdeD (DUF308 family)